MSITSAIQSLMGGKMSSNSGGAGGAGVGTPFINHGTGNGLRSALSNFGTKMGDADAKTGMPGSTAAPSESLRPKSRSEGLASSIRQSDGQKKPLMNDNVRMKLARTLAFIAEANGMGGNTPAHQAAAAISGRMEEEEALRAANAQRQGLIGALNSSGMSIPGAEFLDPDDLQSMVMYGAKERAKTIQMAARASAKARRTGGGGRKSSGRGRPASSGGGGGTTDADGRYFPPANTSGNKNIIAYMRGTGATYKEAFEALNGGGSGKSSAAANPYAPAPAGSPAQPAAPAAGSIDDRLKQIGAMIQSSG
ncbi:hypothetical protein [uncultured Pelagimonas sp.]|uniref:hypothetical protein n=1 Tax=uncultured Pelagimonas sp. TaxID=1618102 RepID=UPI00262BAD1E|nr:hypothetical protein [uncultured Pelagimonas sp.]